MPEDPLRFTVDAAALGRALRQLHRHGARTPGPGIWRIATSELTVEWKGGAHTMDIEGSGSAAFRVDATFMQALAKTLPKTGTLELRLSPERVRFGTFSVPKVDVQDGATDLLPVGADDLQVLMLAYLHEASTIENAGLTTAVDERRERLVETHFRIGLRTDLGDFLVRMGRSGEGEAVFRKLIEDHPDDPTGFVQLATLLARGGGAGTERALELLRDARSLPDANHWDVEARLRDLEREQSTSRERG